MPRAESVTGSLATSSLQGANNLLKRNQACHQCRKRKLKCDTQKPCSTCAKSHRFAANSNPSLLGLEPECTYDPVSADGNPIPKPRAKYKVLEERISELEAMLKTGSATGSVSSGDTPAEATNTSFISESSLSVAMSELSSDNLPDYPSLIADPLLTSPPRFAAHSIGSVSPGQPPPLSNQALQLLNYAPGASDQQLVWADWPPRLPLPDLLHHLVEVFFNCYPHAHYMLHRPTFMSSLVLSPKSLKFPHVSLLHAICAYASVFSYLVESPPMPDLDQIGPDIIFGDRRYAKKSTPESFGDRHARWAKETRDEATALGFNLLECLQSLIIATGYYHTQGRWVELWMSAGQAMRYCVALTLNHRTYCNTNGHSPEEESLLFNPVNYVEREQRVNTFWMAYATERFQTTPSGWAMNFDDEDVHQVLPFHVSYYEAGENVDEPRQTMRTHNILLTHLHTADSFTLYIKGAILLSKVKTFNLRVRHQHPEVTDIRQLPEFKALEEKLISFRRSFPQSYNEPVVQSNRGLDGHLYVAHLIPHYAMSLLHEKLADLSSPNCLSTQKAMSATRASLSLIYAVCSTSYDITRLPPMSALCWYQAASFLIRMFKAEIGAGHHGEACVIDSEIKTIYTAFSRMAQRIPLALRYLKMIDDEIENGIRHCSQSMQSAFYERLYGPRLSITGALDGDQSTIWPNIQPDPVGAINIPAARSVESQESLFQFDQFSC